MGSTPDRIKGHLLAFVSVLVWGVSFISTKILVADMGPISVLLCRMCLGYVILWLMYPKWESFKELRTELYLIICAVSGVTLYYLCENSALMFTQASNTSILVSTAPLLTGILAHWFTGQSVGKLFYLGFILAFVGIIIVSWGGSDIVELNPRGDLLALGAALCWAVYSLVAKCVGDSGMNIITLTRRIFFYGIILSLPFYYILGEHLEFSVLVKPVMLLNMALLGVFSSALCYLAWNRAITLIGAVKTNMYIYVTPVVTVICLAIVLSEAVTMYIVTGTLLILAGLVVSSFDGGKTQG
ncbi:MAG: DMT family transporter [Oscillospiraceae bacterium]|nr:DMT family transporter [Oscillospiraceae bacterium]